MSKFTKSFAGRFTAKYTAGDAYITVSAYGREIDVINISHYDSDLTRTQFLHEVADSAEYIDSAYATEDILTLPLA